MFLSSVRRKLASTSISLARAAKGCEAVVRSAQQQYAAFSSINIIANNNNNNKIFNNIMQFNETTKRSYFVQPILNAKAKAAPAAAPAAAPSKARAKGPAKVVLKKTPKKVKVLTNHQVKSARNTELLKKIYESARKQDAAIALDSYQFLTIRPDVKLYTALIKSLVKEGLLTEAVSIYYDMKKQRVTPNALTFRNLILVAEAANHLPRAFWFIKEMLKYKRVATPGSAEQWKHVISAYDAVMRMCVVNAEVTRATSLYILMRQKRAKVVISAADKTRGVVKQGHASFLKDDKFLAYMSKFFVEYDAFEEFVVAMERVRKPTPNAEIDPSLREHLRTKFSALKGIDSEILKKAEETEQKSQ